ncbi:MAG: hypothetical protein ACKVX7_01695 [Planctomycetota bacterium]
MKSHTNILRISRRADDKVELKAVVATESIQEVNAWVNVAVADLCKAQRVFPPPTAVISEIEIRDAVKLSDGHGPSGRGCSDNLDADQRLVESGGGSVITDKELR